METPSKQELKVFLEVLTKLSLFEANHRLLRGWGEFKEEECPIPEVTVVSDWLRSLIEEAT